MDRPATPVDSFDAESHTPPETAAARLNPFEDDADVSARKRRRTSVSSSHSPSRDANQADKTSRASAAEMLQIREKTPELPAASDSSTETNGGAQTPQSLDSLPVKDSPGELTLSLRRMVDEDDNTPSQKENEHLSTPLSLGSENRPIHTPEEERTPDEDTAMLVPPDDQSSGSDIQEVITPPELFPFRKPEDELHEPVHRLALCISADRSINIKNLEYLLIWMQQAIAFMKNSERSIQLFTLEAHIKFWASFPLIMKALKSKRAQFENLELGLSTIKDIFGLYSQLTAELVHLDHETIRSALTSTSIPKDGIVLFSPELLRGWLDLLNFDESDGIVGTEHRTTPTQWRRSYVARVLLDPLSESRGNTTQWIDTVVRDLSTYVITHKNQVSEFAFFTWILKDCVKEARRLLYNDPSGPVQSEAALCLRRSRKTWLVLSDALSMLLEKDISLLSSENAGRLICALADILELICQRDQALEDQPSELDGIDTLFRKYTLKYPDMVPEILARAVPWAWRLEVLVKRIQSEPMSLRVMAINTLCDSLSDLWNNRNENEDEYSSIFVLHLAETLDTDLVDYILGPSCHPEIILGSANIIRFLVLSEVRTESLIDRLWNSITSSQDQRVSDAIARIIISTVSLFQYTHLVHLCEKFQTLRFIDFSPPLRTLWECIIKEMINKKRLLREPLTAHPFMSTLRVFRDIPVTDDGTIHAYPDLHLAAMQRLRELLAYGLEADVRQELYRDCVNDVASKSTHTLGSLWFLSLCIRPGLVIELKYLTEVHDIVKLLVEELESSLATASPSSSFVISGYANQPRRDLISQIICLQPATIVDELGHRLWDALVGAGASNAGDRSSAWQMIHQVGRSGFQNSFLQICFTQYLPHLSADLFCEGMLEFVKEHVLQLVGEGAAFNMDDDELVANSGIEHLWRIILLAHDDNIAKTAIALLISAVYLDSQAITSCPLLTAQNIHLRLVRRCLRLMREAGDVIHADSAIAMVETDSAVVMTPEVEKLQTKQKFSRALRLLSCFLDAHRAKPQYAVADPWSLIPKSAAEMKGEPALLQYQSFSDFNHSKAQPITIGRENSLGSLLAILRDETGFQNYRAYHRGKQLILTDSTVCESLQARQIVEGLILVKNEPLKPDIPLHVKPGSSVMEIEIMSHFPELWQYLDVNRSAALEIYCFLLKMPADGQLMARIDSDGISYTELFAPDQPFRTLYTMFVITEYLKEARYHRSFADNCSAWKEVSYSRALDRTLRFLSAALDDESITRNASTQIQTKVATILMANFTRALEDITVWRDAFTTDGIPKPSAHRMISVLDQALSFESEDSAHLAANCVTLILRLSLIDDEFWLAVADSPLFPQLLTKICVLDSKKRFREFGITLVEDVAKKACQEPHKDGRIAKYLWNWVLGAVTNASRLEDQCHEVMRLMYILIGTMHDHCPESIDLQSLCQLLSEYLAKHTSTEGVNMKPLRSWMLTGVQNTEQELECDVVANGLANLLHICLQRDRSLAGSLSSTTIWIFLRKHLFPEEHDRDDGNLPKIILHADTRFKLYECIFLNLRAQRDTLAQVMQFLAEMVPFYSEDEDPYIYDLPFQFEQSKALRSKAGYVGLQNLSNTCYLNSLITQLYMNVDFRNYMLSLDVEGSDDSKALLYQTQKLFGYLKESIRRAVEPTDFVATIKTYEQGPIDITNQMDVDEFYNLLCDRWEDQLPNAVAKRRFRSIYGGQLVQQIKSKECNHISERLEPFSAIQCDIKGKSTLEDSLRAYVGGEIMDGDNKYKCSSCDRHVDAVKRACLKDVPDNLIFHLKRFEFNVQTLQRSKIDDYFAFPEMLDMHPYTIEYLTGSSPQAKRQDLFQLVGVLVHAGTAESGHYYSYVRVPPETHDEPVKWIEFNDDAVSLWDPSLMEEATFGGLDRRAAADGHTFDKVHSAYMLFYRRTSSLQHAAEQLSVSQLGRMSQVEIDQGLKDHIRSENILLLRRHCLFDPSHAKFVQGCISSTLDDDHNALGELHAVSLEDKEELGKRYKARELAIETGVNYLDQIFSRAKDPSAALHFCSKLAELAKHQQDCAFNLYSYFSQRPAVLRGLLMRNPEHGIRARVGDVFVMTLENMRKSCTRFYYPPGSATASATSDHDEDGDDEMDCDERVLPRAVKLLDHLWKGFHNQIRAWDAYFTTVLKVAQLGRAECAEILAANYLEKCVTIISADHSMQLEPIYMRMVQNVQRWFGSQPPSYVAVLGVIDYLMSQLEPEISNETIVEDAVERLASTNGYFPWTSGEVSLLMRDSTQGSCSQFLLRLLAIDQAPTITRRILERIVTAGPIPTQMVLRTLRNVIRSDADTEPLDSYIQAASVAIDCCREVADAEQLIDHICRQAPSFQNGEGLAFLELMQNAIDSSRASEEERAQLRVSTLRTIPTWAPHLLRYPDLEVRDGTEQLVDRALLPEAGDEGSVASTETLRLPSELGLAIGSSCLLFLRNRHIRTGQAIRRELSETFQRVLYRCHAIVHDSKSLAEEAKEAFVARYEEIRDATEMLTIEGEEDDESDWDGSVVSSSEVMEEEVQGAEAKFTRNNG